MAVAEFNARVGINYRVGGWSMCLGKRRIAASIVLEFFPVDVEYKLGRVEVETIGLGNHHAIFRSKQMAPVDDVLAGFGWSGSGISIRTDASPALHTN